MTSRSRHVVRAIRIDEEPVPFDRRATLEVEGGTWPDFRLEFWTLAGARIPVGRVDVDVEHGRTFRGYGSEPSPNPWFHVIVSSGGQSGWLTRASQPVERVVETANNEAEPEPARSMTPGGLRQR